MPVKAAAKMNKSADPLKKSDAASKPKVLVKNAGPACKPATRISKGDALPCDVCGLSDVVDTVSGYAGETVVNCCDKPMKVWTQVNTKSKK